MSDDHRVPSARIGIVVTSDRASAGVYHDLGGPAIRDTLRTFLKSQGKRIRGFDAQLALRGAEVIVLPAAFTMTTGKDHWEILIRARAIENGVFMVAPGQVGADESGKWCYGRSLIVDPWGIVLATAPDTETVIAATLDRSLLEKTRRQVPSLANRMPERYAWPELHVAVR